MVRNCTPQLQNVLRRSWAAAFLQAEFDNPSLPGVESPDHVIVVVTTRPELIQEMRD
jgi:hypothetical protein